MGEQTMPMDISGATPNTSVDPSDNFGVSVLKKSHNNQKMVGEAAVKLIDQSGQVASPQMTKTEDGHISVRA
jgi:hypothetical protein